MISSPAGEKRSVIADRTRSILYIDFSQFYWGSIDKWKAEQLLNTRVCLPFDNHLSYMWQQERCPSWVIIHTQHLGFYKFSLASFSLDRSSCFALMKIHKISQALACMARLVWASSCNRKVVGWIPVPCPTICRKQPIDVSLFPFFSL